MRRAMIAAALTVLPMSVHAQSRPAPDTPAASGMAEESARLPQPHFTDALRVLVVTSGIIGGFIAADVMSGGVLTAPLLAGGALTSAGIDGAGLFARAAPIRPIIAGVGASSAITEAGLAARVRGAGLTSTLAGVGRPVAAGFANLSRFVGSALAAPKPVP